MTPPRTPRPTAEDEARAIAAIARSGKAYISPKTYADLRRAIADKARFDEHPPKFDPAAVELIVNYAVPDGVLMSLDEFTRLDVEVLLRD